MNGISANRYTRNVFFIFVPSGMSCKIWYYHVKTSFFVSFSLYYYPSTSCFLCSFFKMHNRKALIR
uniref:Uncharacterized protein n=1 Tax=Kuenenia stuttgartiensis TaxID=174633 RepID=Q1PX20_KUEST|nr:unknown protein [Candidatus Kuenenia stuttgartiensis]